MAFRILCNIIGGNGTMAEIPQAHLFQGDFWLTARHQSSFEQLVFLHGWRSLVGAWHGHVL